MGACRQMGEAKRRKERLGEAYWKGQPNSKGYGWKRALSVDADFDTDADTNIEVSPQTEKDIEPEVAQMLEQSIDGMAIAVSQIKDAGFDANSINHDDLAEAIRLNFFSELEGLERSQSDSEGTFGWGRLQIFKAVLLCLVDDSQLSPEEVKTISKQIHEAGEKMYEIDGMQGLKDPLIWLFIPQGWKRRIDNAFNGIGDWVS